MSARAAREFAERLGRTCVDALGTSVESVVLHGSLASGGFVPGRSDIDLLVVAAHPLTDDQLAALADAVRAVAPEAPARVDLRVVTRAVALSPRRDPPLEVEVAVRPGSEPPVRVEARVPGEPDVVVELSICRRHGIVLRGRSPAEVIGPVPDSWVADVGDAQLADWQALPFEPYYAELMVFTACRVWRFAVEAVHCPKRDAAQWVLERDPRLQAVHDALRRRHVDGRHVIAEAPVRDLLAAARGRLAQARGAY